ncbi:MAG: hypothetical protein IIA61_14510 [Candidatus Marinimicrobia bacterium]|nr:hypothetical protein [Candidatus Neomarinimicrobiota bacterium]
MRYPMVFISNVIMLMTFVNVWSQQEDSLSFKLPPAHTFFAQDTSNLKFSKKWRGIPLSLDGISALRIGERDVIWIPVLMNEPELPIKLEALTMMNSQKV